MDRKDSILTKIKKFYSRFLIVEKQNEEVNLDTSLTLPTIAGKKVQIISPNDRKSKILILESNNKLTQKEWIKVCIKQDLTKVSEREITNLQGTIIFSPDLQFSANITRLLQNCNDNINVNLINSVSPYTSESSIKKINILNFDIATVAEQLETLFEINTFQEKEALVYFLILLKMTKDSDTYTLSELRNLIRERDQLTSSYYTAQNHYVNVPDEKMKDYLEGIFGVEIADADKDSNKDEKSIDYYKKQIKNAMEWLHDLLMENNIGDEHFEEKTGVTIRLQNHMQKALINQQIKNLFIAAQSYQWLKASDFEGTLTIVTLPRHYENHETTAAIDNPFSNLVISNILDLLNSKSDTLYSLYFAGIDNYLMPDFLDKLKEHISSNLFITASQSLTASELEYKNQIIVKDK